MYLKSGFDPEISACIATEIFSVEEMYLLNDSHYGEGFSFAISSVCSHTQEHYFHIPAVSIDPGRFISVYIPSSVLPYSINSAFPGVVGLFVTVTSPILKTLSRVVSFLGRVSGAAGSSKKKRSFTICRPCVLRL